MARGRKRRADAAPSSWRRSRLLRFAVRLAAVLVLIPLVMTVVYKFVPPVSTLMIYDRIVDGPIRRQWVPFDQISPALVAAAVMSEDGRYCSHQGVDWGALGGVIEEWDQGGPPRGASTIAMQTARNLFLWTSRSYIRKAIEIPLALYVDAMLGKRRLMEIYLNIAQLGPGIFGVEAAAQHYFSRPAANVSLMQAALLIATLPNPDARDPARPSQGLTARARHIEAQARIAGAYIDCLHP